MRMLSLADSMKKLGFEVLFLSKYKIGIDIINKKGYMVHIINSELLNEEHNEIIVLMNETNTKLLIIDSYKIDFNYLYKIKTAGIKTIYIDDLNNFIYPVDMLVNGNICAEDLNYKKYNENTIHLLGVEYNLIREEFKELPNRIINREVKQIMITTGGSDPYNMSEKILKALIRLDNSDKLVFNVVVTEGFINKNEIYKMAERTKNITVYENPEKISEIMLYSDIAISSGGSTLYELCSCGTPTISFIMADNQRYIVEKLMQFNAIGTLGWYNQLDDKDSFELIQTLIHNFGTREKMSIIGQALIDGKGSVRVATYIKNLS